MDELDANEIDELNELNIGYGFDNTSTWTPHIRSCQGSILNKTIWEIPSYDEWQLYT